MLHTPTLISTIRDRHNTSKKINLQLTFRRGVGDGWAGGQLPTQDLEDQLTLSQPGGAYCAQPALGSFLRP